MDFTGTSWQPNQSRVDATLPSGQSESQVMNGGINIGTVNPGWNTQGSVVVSFRVSSTSVNPPNNHTNNNTCRIDYFRVSDDDIEEGDRVTFSWDASDCSYVTLTTFSERMNTNDSISARPTYSREYCLNAYGNGTDRECLDIDVDEDIIDEEENVDIEVATRSATSISESDATLNGFIDPNDSYATRWFRYGTSSGNLSRSTNRVNHGYNRANFSADIFNLAPNTRYYFQAVGENSDTTEYGKILNFNTNASVVDDNDSLSAVTTVATGISQSSAVINGLVLNTENIQTNAYFEYGRNVDFGSRTITKNLGSGLALNTFDTIYGLSPNTFYYFRVVGENGNGKGTFIKHFKKIAEINKNTFKNLKFSDPLAETLKLWDIPITISNFQKLPIAMENTYGKRCLTKVIEDRIKKSGEYFIIVDGVRWKSDIEMLRGLHESKIRFFSLIYIIANAEIRYEKIQARKEKASEDCVSLRQFTEKENTLIEKDIKTLGSNYAHYIIDNNGEEIEFAKKIEELFVKLLVKFW